MIESLSSGVFGIIETIFGTGVDVFSAIIEGLQGLSSNILG